MNNSTKCICIQAAHSRRISTSSIVDNGDNLNLARQFQFLKRLFNIFEVGVGLSEMFFKEYTRVGIFRQNSKNETFVSNISMF